MDRLTRPPGGKSPDRDTKWVVLLARLVMRPLGGKPGKPNYLNEFPHYASLGGKTRETKLPQ